MKFKVNDRVHYAVYPSGLPDRRTAGTVVKVNPTLGIFYVYWDDVNRALFPPTSYAAGDLAIAS